MESAARVRDRLFAEAGVAQHLIRVRTKPRRRVPDVGWRRLVARGTAEERHLTAVGVVQLERDLVGLHLRIGQEARDVVDRTERDAEAMRPRDEGGT